MMFSTPAAPEKKAAPSLIAKTITTIDDARSVIPKNNGSTTNSPATNNKTVKKKTGEKPYFKSKMQTTVAMATSKKTYTWIKIVKKLVLNLSNLANTNKTVKETDINTKKMEAPK